MNRSLFMNTVTTNISLFFRLQFTSNSRRSQSTKWNWPWKFIFRSWSWGWERNYQENHLFGWWGWAAISPRHLWGVAVFVVTSRGFSKQNSALLLEGDHSNQCVVTDCQYDLRSWLREPNYFMAGKIRSFHFNFVF